MRTVINGSVISITAIVVSLSLSGCNASKRSHEAAAQRLVGQWSGRITRPPTFSPLKNADTKALQTVEMIYDFKDNNQLEILIKANITTKTWARWSVIESQDDNVTIQLKTRNESEDDEIGKLHIVFDGDDHFERVDAPGGESSASFTRITTDR